MHGLCTCNQGFCCKVQRSIYICCIIIICIYVVLYMQPDRGPLIVTEESRFVKAKQNISF